MTGFLKVYGASLLAFLALDALWLGLVARSFYREHLSELLRPDPRWGPALLFYAVFVAGIVILVTLPAVERSSLGRAVTTGALFGFVTYAAYDLTNLAVLRGFPVIVAVVDLAWGAAITAAVAAAGYLAAHYLGA